MSDDEDFMVKAFPVGRLIRDGTKINPNEPPADAIDYLRLVAFEASKCDDVVVAKIDESKLKKQTVVYQIEDKPSSSLAPSREWKICQVSDFSNLRIDLAKLRVVRKDCPLELPDNSEESQWCVFCMGSKFAKEVPYLMKGRRLRPEELEVEGHPPLLSIICAMNQPTLEAVLQYHVTWLESKYSEEQGRWLYALLAGLEQPLTPDICSLLRTMARTCACLRDQKVTKGEEEGGTWVTSLNLLICLVSLYFRQLDLEDI